MERSRKSLSGNDSNTIKLRLIWVNTHSQHTTKNIHWPRYPGSSLRGEMHRWRQIGNGELDVKRTRAVLASYIDFRKIIEPISTKCTHHSDEASLKATTRIETADGMRRILLKWIKFKYFYIVYIYNYFPMRLLSQCVKILFVDFNENYKVERKKGNKYNRECAESKSMPNKPFQINQQFTLLL